MSRYFLLILAKKTLGDDVVHNKYLVVFPGFLKMKGEEDKQLTLMGRLHEIVALEFGNHLPIWAI